MTVISTIAPGVICPPLRLICAGFAGQWRFALPFFCRLLGSLLLQSQCHHLRGVLMVMFGKLGWAGWCFYYQGFYWLLFRFWCMAWAACDWSWSHFLARHWSIKVARACCLRLLAKVVSSQVSMTLLSKLSSIAKVYFLFEQPGT